MIVYQVKSVHGNVVRGSFTNQQQARDFRDELNRQAELGPMFAGEIPKYIIKAVNVKEMSK